LCFDKKQNDDEDGEEENTASDEEEDATLMSTVWKNSSTGYLFVPLSSTTSATDSGGANASTSFA
jgi:hypothetical protein